MNRRKKSYLICFWIVLSFSGPVLLQLWLDGGLRGAVDGDQSRRVSTPELRRDAPAAECRPCGRRGGGDARNRDPRVPGNGRLLNYNVIVKTKGYMQIHQKYLTLKT